LQHLLANNEQKIDGFHCAMREGEGSILKNIGLQQTTMDVQDDLSPAHQQVITG
jgi:hypothetical protein